MSLLPPNRPVFPEEIWSILKFVQASRGFNPAGYCSGVIVGRVESRLEACKLSAADYLSLLTSTPSELDILVETLTVKVSSFFRDPLVFEYLNDFVLPTMLAGKASERDHSLRIWSAGCAHGEEAYTLAILLNELAQLNPAANEANLFATDIDEKALIQAEMAIYPAASLANVRHGLMNDAFIREGDSFRVRPGIASRVRFSVYDMLDFRRAAPSESVFGSFDLILCRNLLIYFQTEYQEFICEKLYRSLREGGFLLLGRTECLPEAWSGRFLRVTDCCSLYRKPNRTVRPPP